MWCCARISPEELQLSIEVTWTKRYYNTCDTAILTTVLDDLFLNLGCSFLKVIFISYNTLRRNLIC